MTPPLVEGLEVTARFVCNVANHLVTFARLVLKGEFVDLSNNLVERLMGEVAKRVKHRWMHWSACGLENLLNILLLRYCNRSVCGAVKERYLSSLGLIVSLAVT